MIAGEMVRIVPRPLSSSLRGFAWLVASWLCVVVCVVVAGCAVDSGAGAPDAGVDLVDGSPSPSNVGDASIDGGGSASRGELADDPANADACWNGLDDDANGLADCDELGCSSSPLCCLGRSTPACCDATDTRVLVEFTRCAGPRPAECGSPATAFGEPASTLEETSPTRAFVPNGNTFDSGLVYAAPLDGAREVVELRATIAAPSVGCADCVDVIAFGVAAPVPTSVMRPDVVVLVRASRGDVALFVAGEVVATRALSTDVAREYALRLSPDGGVRLTIDGGDPMTARWLPRADRRAVLYGRTQNRPADAPPPARALSFTLLAGGCEVPAALAHEGRALVPEEGWSQLPARAPSAVRDGEDVLLAFELGPDVHLARLAPDGSLTLGGSGDVSLPVLVAAGGEALRDPELVREDDRWAIYVTRARGDARTLARAVGEPDFAEVFADPVDLLGGEDLSAPAVTTFRGGRILAAVSGAGVESRILLFDLVDAALQPHGAPSSPAVAVGKEDVLRFDADEVGGPALYVDAAGTLRLYYAGRRGTRWSIGMRASGDGIHWPYAPAEPVLAPIEGGPAAFGVLDPSVAVVDGVSHLFHTATDGAAFVVGRATGATRW